MAMPAVPKSRKFVIFPFGRVRTNVLRKPIMARTGTRGPSIVSGAVSSIHWGGRNTVMPLTSRESGQVQLIRVV